MNNTSNGRILICVNDVLTVNRLVQPQAIGFASAGWDVMVFAGCGQLDPEFENNQIKVFQSKYVIRSMNPLIDMVSFFVLLRQMLVYKPTVVIGSTPKIAFIAIVVSRILGVGTRIYQIRGAGWQTKNFFRRHLLKILDGITIAFANHRIVVSEGLKQDYEVHFPQYQFITIGSGGSKGVDGQVFQFNSKHKTNLSAPKFGFLGRFTRDKGIGELVSFFDRVLARYPEATLDLIGYFDLTDPIDSQSALTICQNKAIKVFPNLSQLEISKRASSWDIHIFLSYREGLPNAVLETAACGVPTVGWMISGIKEATPPLPYNYLVTLNDFDALFSQVVNLLNREDLSTIRAYTSEWTFENFCQEKVIANFVSKVETLAKH
jgi:glycosyltransferase involved in cell wall biosynthesis